MRQELDEQLCKKYPGLYRDRHADPAITLMCWGFECGDGWWTLIDVVSELITKHNPDITAVQIKEKFGTLRFYHASVDDYSLAVESAAEMLSTLICEVCSAHAKRRANEGWLSSLCDEHNDNYVAEYNSLKKISRVELFGLGKFWSDMMHKLIELCVLNADQNNMPSALINAEKINNKLVIELVGGDEFTRGAVDLFTLYANRVDECTGLPTDSDNEELS